VTGHAEDAAVRIRRALAGDRALLTEFGARAFQEAFAAQNSAEDMALYTAAAFNPGRQAQELSEPGSIFLIAERAGLPVGYARVRLGAAPALDPAPGERPMELARLYVDARSTGGGIGAALMDACLDTARAAGCDYVWLSAWEENTGAIRFYRREGFLVLGRAVFMLGTDPQRDLLMGRAVGLPR
jgi:ribosomal protein S18 acetylase RimI-like enzyme